MAKPHVALRLVLALLIDVTAMDAQSMVEGRLRQDSAIVSEPNHPLSLRPRLSLVQALKIADRYIQREHIDVSSYWLSDARFIMYGDTSKGARGAPSWYFCWQNAYGSLGDYVEVIVSMDGKAMRSPSM